MSHGVASVYMRGFEFDLALPTLYRIWDRYVDSPRPGEQRIAEVVREMIDELEGSDPEADGDG